MREHHGRIGDPDQPVQTLKPVRADPEGGARRCDRGQPPGTRGQQGQGPLARFQLADPRGEHPLKLPGQRQRLGQRFGPGELGRAEGAGQLDEGQRVARGGCEQRITDGRRQRGAA